jgi:hypothetical protein
MTPSDLLVAVPLIFAILVVVWLLRRHSEGRDGSWPSSGRTRSSRLRRSGSRHADGALAGVHLYADGGDHEGGDVGGGDSGGGDGGGGGGGNGAGGGD